MKEHNQFNNVNLFVDKLSNETEWNEKKKINKNKIIYRYNNDSNFTLFSIRIPKLPKKEEIIMKIDAFIPIVILILTLFIAFIV